MRKDIYQAGIIAIPLKINSQLNPSPNFLVIDYQSGKSISLSPNLETGILELNDCVSSSFRLVQREILEKEAFKQEELIERVLLPSQSLDIPVDLLTVLFNHSRIKQNIQIVNLALSRFSFRGVLSNLVLEVDEAVLDEIIAQENAENEPQ